MKKLNLTLEKLILSLILIFTFSCMKKTDLEDENLGTPVTAEKVQTEMFSGLGTINFDNVLINEQNIITSSITYSNSQTIPLFLQSLTVAAVSSTETSTILAFYASRSDYQNSANSFTNQLTGFQIDYSSIQNVEKNMSINSEEKNKLIYQNLFNQIKQNKLTQIGTKETNTISVYYLFFYYYNLIVGCSADNQPCYNFTTQEKQITLSEELADSRLCDDSKNCTIDVKTIEFDYLDYSNLQENGKPERRHYSIIVGKKLPLFSKVISFCERGLASFNDKKIIYDQCFNLKSFAIGDESK